MSSPLLSFSGAVEAEGTDAGVAAHYGDPYREQRLLAEGSASVDLSHLPVLAVSGADRLSWLHALTSQHLSELPAGRWTEALVLSPHGHVEHHLRLLDDGATTFLVIEPGTSEGLLAFLDSMRFLLRVEVRDVSGELAVVRQGRGPLRLLARAELPDWAHAQPALAGIWAEEALRVETRRPRLGFETDHRTIPQEVGWLETAVHLSKGCYRGQETVARVHNLGRPPRRLVFLHLDGTEVDLPGHGTEVTLEGRQVGFVTSSARHHELGPIALALVKRNTPVEAVLQAGGIAAAQELAVAP